MSVKLDKSKLNMLRREVKPRAGKILGDVAHNVAGQAQQNAPVDKGDLRDSIEAEQQGDLKWIVHDGVEYGIYQELGTSKMAAQPFMVPAVESNRSDFISSWGALFRV